MISRIQSLMITLCLFGTFTTLVFSDETIRLGAIFAIIGPAANLGAPEARTLEMLVEDINAKKGGIIGRKVELVVKDTGGIPEKAASILNPLSC